ncbi:ATP-dependent RNA helicase HrpA [Myxococcota bacterium]|nr:ATP-dependent RNA helicase HrpA [Myxococcota bacterium]
MNERGRPPVRRERPLITFPAELPITAKVDDLKVAIERHPVVIVAGATGSGKTTQLPKIALALGRGQEKLIGVTQPRRIAATSVAARVASELGTPLGADVGYQIRFDDKTSNRTSVKFMTDGILLAEIQGNRKLTRYDTLIIDEAHERSLTIDFLLGWLRRILPERPDLKVIISSATIEHERFSELFGGAPVVQVEGRTFPVDVLYEPPPEDDALDVAVANAVENVIDLDPRGDILVFLPGEREIREAESELRARSPRNTEILPLYGRLAGSDQGKVFTATSKRRVVLATNVAETSLTIPGIVYVVDAGIARLSRYDPKSGTTRLQIEAISQASAEQRKGRCGRVRDGVCIRLYDEESYRARPEYTDPEIKRTGLAGVILRMKSLGLGDVEDFPFLDPPAPRAITEGYRVLEELGALDEKRELTKLGHQLARFPVDPRIARMIVAGAELGCLEDVLVVCAALNVQDPRERPRDAQQKADDLHRRFRDERSDFVTLLKLWDFVQEAQKKGSSNLRRTCRDNFLSFMRVREWFEVHRQLVDIVRELRLHERRGSGGDDALHKALVTGLLSKIGTWNAEKRSYTGAKQTRFMIHPSSGLAKKPPAWVTAFELVETSQLFARTAAKIEPEWLLEVAADLVKKSYSEPHWSERNGRAYVKETSTLFGLTIFRDRNVDLSNIDPHLARRMFIEHALVRGEYKSKGVFQAKNRALLDEVSRLRNKARKSDMMANEDALAAFFDARLPEDVVNGKVFEEWREHAEKGNAKLLLLSIDDVLTSDDELSPKDYPDELTLHGTKVRLAYEFDPASDADGVTITLPLVLLPQLEPGELHWTIPGWHREKLRELLEALPKSIRRELGGELDALAKTIAPKLTPFQGALLPQLARELYATTKVDVPEDAFRLYAIPHFLRLNVRVVDESGKVVDESREVDELLARHGAKARAAWKSAAPPPAFEKTNLVTWDFGLLPPFVARRTQGVEVRSYPALVDRGQSVDLVLMESQGAAEEATRAGVRRLLMLGARATITLIKRDLPPAFAKPSGANLDKHDHDAFRAVLLARIVDEAHGLVGGAPLPRDKETFEALAKTGTPRLDPVFQLFDRAIGAVAPELERTVSALKNASKTPSGKAAITELRAHLETLFPNDLLAWIPLVRLAEYPRYLKAAQSRLQRAVNDPRKDADKLAPIAPLWRTFLDKRATYRDRAAADELRWQFEELRVATFAPELKPAQSVSLAKLTAALAALR